MSARDTILSALRLVFPTFAASDGSVEAKMIDVVGTYADSEAIERQNSVNVINDALANQRITTRDYYRRKSVAFQMGDAIAYDPVNFGAYYPVVDPAKQIIKQAYIVGAYPLFTLLVNAIGGDGHLRALTELEISAFRTYFQAFQPLGMNITVNSMDVAKISDPGIVVYIRAGADAATVASQINAALIAYESEFRLNNTVTLSEIEDVMQRVDGVRAIGWSTPTATETRIDGTTVTVTPDKGVFPVQNGAFTFTTEITTANISVIV